VDVLAYNTVSPDRQTWVAACRENESTYANIWPHCRSVKEPRGRGFASGTQAPHRPPPSGQSKNRWPLCP